MLDSLKSTVRKGTRTDPTRLARTPRPHLRSKYLVRSSYLQIYNEVCGSSSLYMLLAREDGRRRINPVTVSCQHVWAGVCCATAWPHSAATHTARTIAPMQVVSDLLKPERSSLAIREDRRRGVFVEGLSEWVVRSPAEVYGLIQRGQSLVSGGGAKRAGAGGRAGGRCVRGLGHGYPLKNVALGCASWVLTTAACMHQSMPQRATGATKLNEVSSRSHAVCVIIVEKCTTPQQQQAADGGEGGVAGAGKGQRTDLGDRGEVREEPMGSACALGVPVHATYRT